MPVSEPLSADQRVGASDEVAAGCAAGRAVTRRSVLLAGASAVVAAGVPLPAWAGDAAGSAARRRFVYVGTYTAPGVPPGGTRPSKAVGIYVFRLNPQTGGLVPLPALTVPASNPSYLALNPSGTTLYCVHEDPVGQVSAFRVNPSTGGLTLLNTLPTEGENPTHLSVGVSGRYLFAANYSSGSYPVYLLRPDGGIDRRTDLFHGTGNGTGPNPDRQEAPHAHQILARNHNGTTYVF